MAVFVACMEFGAPIERFGVFYAFSMCLCCGNAERGVIVLLSSYRKIIHRKMVGLVSWKVVFDLCIGSAGAASGIKANERPAAVGYCVPAVVWCSRLLYFQCVVCVVGTHSCILCSIEGVPKLSNTDRSKEWDFVLDQLFQLVYLYFYFYRIAIGLHF